MLLMKVKGLLNHSSWGALVEKVGYYVVVEVGYCEDIVMELVAGHGLRESFVDN